MPRQVTIGLETSLSVLKILSFFDLQCPLNEDRASVFSFLSSSFLPHRDPNITFYSILFLFLIQERPLFSKQIQTIIRKNRQI